ncbi:phytanoyl-CoA dioxygenase family protein [Alteromonas flava]|uniref:phytanoyl-CoA dioxygenase family protein n=1 Tax=Alteromonas flava TaxID=2048003 RepID=UPI000C286E97|nr:phytanoyl-CoA dioxygenase family protein [Alteromonas flava]
MLSKQQREAFQQCGYVVLPNFFSHEEVAALQAEAEQIVEDFDESSSRSIFSTFSSDTDQDSYFLYSDDKVRCFFEADAFDQQGGLRQDKALSINKIGHALHVLSPTFRAFSTQAKIRHMMLDVGLTRPEIRQSMYIFKQPRIGGQIRWHQDATYFKTDPLSVVTFWLAIQPATIENGCLQVDKRGDGLALKEQFVRYADDHTELKLLHDEPWPNLDQALPLEVDAGSVVLMSGTLPHFSAANRSNHSRHAFTLHVTSADTTYDPLNWLRAEAMPL